MSIKKYLTLGIGIVTGIGVSIAGLSYASYNSSSSMRIITAQKAKDIMLGKVPGCTILEFSYDGDDRIPKYDGTVIKGNYEYEIDVDAKTGDIIKFEKEQILVSNGTSGGNSSNTVNLITSKEAKDIMLNKVPGATIIEFSYDGDDATPKYDGKLIKDNCEYEIDVNAKTGAIIKFEQENIHINNYRKREEREAIPPKAPMEVQDYSAEAGKKKKPFGFFRKKDAKNAPRVSEEDFLRAKEEVELRGIYEEITDFSSLPIAQDVQSAQDTSALDEFERIVYENICGTGTSDEIAAAVAKATGAPADTGAVLGALTTLEIEGFCQSLPGGLFKKL